MWDLREIKIHLRIFHFHCLAQEFMRGAQKCQAYHAFFNNQLLTFWTCSNRSMLPSHWNKMGLLTDFGSTTLRAKCSKTIITTLVSKQFCPKCSSHPLIKSYRQDYVLLLDVACAFSGLRTLLQIPMPLVAPGLAVPNNLRQPRQNLSERVLRYQIKRILYI